jgi:hypothetical protein
LQQPTATYRKSGITRAAAVSAVFICREAPIQCLEHVLPLQVVRQRYCACGHLCLSGMGQAAEPAVAASVIGRSLLEACQQGVIAPWCTHQLKKLERASLQVMCDPLDSTELTCALASLCQIRQNFWCKLHGHRKQAWRSCRSTYQHINVRTLQTHRKDMKGPKRVLQSSKYRTRQVSGPYPKTQQNPQ